MRFFLSKGLLRCTSLLLALCLAVTLTGCSEKKNEIMAAYAEYVGNVDAFDVYYRFLYTLTSADIRKTTVSDTDLFGLLSTTVETMRFNRYGNSVRLLYRERNPFVFFYYPSYDYFDGENYHYKYAENWFVDTTNRYNSRLNLDFCGIPSEFFSDYEVTLNGLYKNGHEYILKIQGHHLETGNLCDITGYADESFVLTRLVIKEEYTDSNEKLHQKKTEILYREVNTSLVIDPPRGMDQA